jgi:hypothetical protein
MIGTLPDIYPGEPLYSLWARHCDRMQYPSKRSVVQELFGTENVVASLELPSHIDDFVAALPPGHHYTADYLIDNHTLLPFYGSFLPPERLRHLRQDMRGRNGPAIHMRAGLMASHVSPPERLRLCPRCVEEDRREVGECYWHLVHQVPGVEVCPVHEVYLYDSDVQAHKMKTRYEFVSAERATQGLRQHELQDAYDETLLKIARDVHWLLSGRGLSQNLEVLNARYSGLLSALGLASYRGRVHTDALLERFRSYYSSELLRLLHCGLGENARDSWLLRLVRTPRNAQHPLHHLLLMYLLGHTAETFFSLPTERQPFGEGPWPCLNPASSHYLQDQVNECRIAYSQHIGGRPVGTFLCSCGFTYARTGPDMKAEDRFKSSKVTAFGQIWENRLCDLWEDEMISLRGIARQLGVDPLTVKRHATRLALPFPRPVGYSLPLKETQQLRSHPTPLLRPKPAKLDTYRAKWLAVRQANPAAGVKELRSSAPDVYVWLYRNDLTWLQEHMPDVQKRRRASFRVDWGARDKLLSDSVKISALRIRDASGSPQRVTVSAIGRHTGQLALLQQHLDKLPLTREVLLDITEKREEFAVRRIRWVAAQHRQRGVRLARWELIRRAGVDRLKNHKDVRIAIDEACMCEEPIT